MSARGPRTGPPHRAAPGPPLAGVAAAVGGRRFGVVVPVKPPGRGKSRLAPLGDRLRQELSTAFACDTVTAAVACVEVAVVLAVTDDLELADRLGARGARAVPDAGAGDLNASLVLGATQLHRRYPDLRLVGLCGDLPCLRPEELAVALRRAAAVRGPTFVPDASGVGTTLYSAPDLASFAPAFGTSSRQAHRTSGAVEVGSGLASVRHDVDTPEDLAAAEALGCGPATAGVLATEAAAGAAAAGAGAAAAAVRG